MSQAKRFLEECQEFNDQFRCHKCGSELDWPEIKQVAAGEWTCPDCWTEVDLQTKLRFCTQELRDAATTLKEAAELGTQLMKGETN